MKSKRIVLAIISCLVIVLIFGLVGCIKKPPANGDNSGNEETITPPTKPEGPTEPIAEKYNLVLYDNQNILKTFVLEKDTDLFYFVKEMDFEPQKQGYEFVGWCKDIELENSLDESLLLTENTNLYAKFAEINISKSFSDGFNGTFALNESDFVFDEKGTKLTKVYVLNRQFEVLATNILFSLANIYGVSLNDNNDGKQDYFKFYFNLAEQSGGTEWYAYNGNNAYFSKSNMILSANSINTKHIGHTGDTKVCATCPACYAEFHMQTPQLDHALLTQLNSTKAINGGGTWDSQSNQIDLQNLQSQFAWKWNYEEGIELDCTTQAVDYVKGFVSKYKDQLKLELAKIISGFTMVSNYGEHLRMIKSSGFTSEQKTKIVNFVKNNIIGTTLISTDDSRKPSNASLEYGAQNWTEKEHNYKAYSILVPLIVEQVFSQTFENTTTSIYPQHNFSSINSTQDGKITLQNKQSAYLNIGKPIDIAGLVIESSRKCSVTIEVCNNGVKQSIRVNLVVGTNYINLLAGVQNIGGFNGKLDYDNGLFGDFPIIPDTGGVNESLISGSNYIKISYNSSAQLKLDISAYLEKEYKEGQIIK